MKMTMDLTLKGLVRALRWKELDLAERVERGTLSAGRLSMGSLQIRRSKDRKIEEDGDDRGGR